MIVPKPGLQALGKHNYWLWLSPLLFMVLVSSYFILRYGGTWAEADSATFSSVIAPFATQGRLVPTHAQVYPNGYAFQAISAVILAMTGLELAQLQQLVYPFLSILVVLPAWLFYREITNSERGAALATILLFTQPEFLFVILRSSHEKFTRSLMLICLYLFARSFRQGNHPRLFALHIVLFYLAIFAFISSNNLLANSFIVSIGLALCLGLIVERRSASLNFTSKAALRRLLFVMLSCLCLSYLFVMYVYKPAEYNLFIIKDTIERIRILFTGAENTNNESYTQAYSYIYFGWISPQVFLLVGMANWIMLVSSFAIWTKQSWAWLRRSQVPTPEARWLVWLLYAAFAFQGVLSVVSDASGALGSNMQHRLFPSVSIIAVGIISHTLLTWQPKRYAHYIRTIFACGLALIAILSVMKATNEPLLSNKWTFYRREEIEAMDWSAAHLKYANIWTEYDERLRVAYLMARGETINSNDFRGVLRLSTRHLIVSDITRLRSSRLQTALPVPSDAFRIYDNGEAQVYHVRSRTPFQH